MKKYPSYFFRLMSGILFLNLLPFLIFSQQMLFWADESTGIWKSNLHGTFQQLIIDDDDATAMEIDVPGGKIYYSDDGDDDIRRANIDGTNIETIVDEDTEIHDLALDLVNKKIYWTTQLDEIKRANLDGSDEELLLDSGDGIGGPEGIDVDPWGGKIYWAEQDDDEIRRADLDGSNDMAILTSLSPPPKAVALDLKSGKIYWTEEDGEIHRANLDGSSVELLVPDINESNGLVLDVKNGKMYWTEDDEADIWKANLDGSDPIMIVDSSDEDSVFEGIALDPTDPIPTLSQWGLICLGLILIIIGTMAVIQQRVVVR